MADDNRDAQDVKSSPRWISLAAYNRAGIQASADVVVWLLTLPLAWVLRVDFALEQVDWADVALAFLVASLLQGGVGYAEGLYTGRHAFGSFEEVAGLARTVVVVTAVGWTANLIFGAFLPRSVPLVAGTLALIAMAGLRYGWRLAIERENRPSGPTATRVLVFGAGQGGSQLLTSMLRNPDSPYLPVGLIDDDPAKQRLRLRGVPVLGNRTSIPRFAAEYEVPILVVAIPSADGALVREISNEAATAGLKVLVLPPVDALLGGSVGVEELRSVTAADLLGRHEIDTDMDSIAGYLQGRRVLVTGAGGSIGSELCRQVQRFGPSALILLDRDESALHSVQLSMTGRALLDGEDLVVADIRDARRLREVFERHRPDVVFHAAALKHLSLLELHPEEAIKTNVLGTLNVLEAALATGVERFVNISTDKAADPSSVLGHTKRIAERLTAWAAGECGQRYLSVRFGNVLGSRGSVLTAFRAQIKAGGPVTVTDPDVTRFFMTVEEAVQLVVQAGALGRGAEVLVLDMGLPVRIVDVARRLIVESGADIEIEFTGLRPGEKLHESLLGRAERDLRPLHPLISHVPVDSMQPSAALMLDDSTLSLTSQRSATA